MCLSVEGDAKVTFFRSRADGYFFYRILQKFKSNVEKQKSPTNLGVSMCITAQMEMRNEYKVSIILLYIYFNIKTYAECISTCDPQSENVMRNLSLV